MRLLGLLVCACAASHPAPTSPPAPTAPAPAKVFLSVLGNQLVPLGCWDGQTLRGDCVALVPAGTRLSVGTVTGRETWSCEANGETRDALVYQGKPPETEHAHVLWPDGTLVG